MADWRHTLDINRLFEDGIPDPIDEPEKFTGLRDTVATELEKSKVFPESLVFAVKRVRSTGGFTQAMDTIYNYADRNLIWMGL